MIWLTLCAYVVRSCLFLCGLFYFALFLRLILLLNERRHFWPRIRSIMTLPVVGSRRTLLFSALELRFLGSKKVAESAQTIIVSGWNVDMSFLFLVLFELCESTRCMRRNKIWNTKWIVSYQECIYVYVIRYASISQRQSAWHREFQLIVPTFVLTWTSLYSACQQQLLSWPAAAATVALLASTSFHLLVETK